MNRGRLPTGPSCARRARRHAERGTSLLLVLMLLTVMLMGGLAFARIGANGILLSGNTAHKEAALRAAEVGLNSAFAEIAATSFDPATPSRHYSPSRLPSDASGLPAFDWSMPTAVPVNEFSVAYVIDRQCDNGAPNDPADECLVRLVAGGGLNSAQYNGIASSQGAAQGHGFTYRVTVRVQGPRGTTTFTQGLVVRGS